MGIDQDDFVKAFVLVLCDDRVARKWQESSLCEMVKTRDEKVNHLQKGIDEMESAIDENEQHSMRNSLQINGVPNILGVTLKFINKELGLATTIVEHDIDRVYRLGARHGTISRPILVKFTKYRACLGLLKK